MKINNIPALQEDILDDTYVMRFPAVPDMDVLVAPFVVTTQTGAIVHTVGEFTIPLRKEVDLSTGVTTITFGMPDERDLKIAALEEQLKAEQAFSAMLEGTMEVAGNE